MTHNGLHWKLPLWVGVLISSAFFNPQISSAQNVYRILDRWVIGGDGSWDYLLADGDAHRLYLAHNARVEVVDTQTGKPLGAITGMKSTHGITLDEGSKTGYISDGAGNAVVVFDRTNFQTLATIPAGKNPDGIVFEPMTHTVWAFNGRSDNVTVIDTASRATIATIVLPGKPEFPAVDGKGALFVNIEDKNEIVKLNAQTKNAVAEWPLADCESPSGLAFDAAGHRLFSVCDGGKMAVTDSESGKSIGTAEIGDSPDAVGYDAAQKLAFSSNGGSGTLSIVDASDGRFQTVQTLATAKGGRTMAFDASSGRIFVATARLGPAPAAIPHPKPAVVSGTFTVLVIGR